jgi:HK97 family phage portal protein
MGFFGRLTTFFGSIGATSQNKGVQDTRPLIKVHKNTPDVGIDGALQVSSVWACIELISDMVGSLPIYVYSQSDGERELARDTKLWSVLHDSPNTRQTPMEFWQCMVMNFLFRGNAFARLERDAKGEVISMFLLASDQVDTKLLEDGSVVYCYYINGQAIIYSSDSILHWKDKGNGILGLSRIDYMMSSVNVAIGAQNVQAKSYSNDNRRSGVFSMDKSLTEKQREQIRKDFETLTESDNDSLLILEAGAKFEPLSLTPQESQLLETRRFSVEDIARWFGIPSILINDLSNRVPYGNNNDLIEFFYKFKLRSMLVSLEQTIKKRVMTRQQARSYTVEFGLDALLRSSLKDRMDIYAKAVQNGIYTRNFARQLENEPPVEGGDVLTAQSNLLPLNLLGKVKVSAQDKINGDETTTVAQ